MTTQKIVAVHLAKAAVRILPTHELSARRRRRRLSVPPLQPAQPSPTPQTNNAKLIDPSSLR